MNNQVWHKIHPLTILIELSRIIKRLLFAFIFVIISLFTGGSAESNMEFFATGLGVIVVIPAVIRYFTFGYSVSKGNLLIKSGLVTKNNRTIPLSRIQNINLSRSLLHRMLGLVDLDIETASGSKAEASISALTEEQAKILRAQLLQQTPKLTSVIHEERNKKLIYKPSFYELFLAGASENRLAAILAALAGLNIFGQGAMEDLIEKQGKNFLNLQAISKNAILLGIAAFAIMLFIGWITSIVSTFFKYYGFELTDEEGGRVKRSYGLFQHVENVLLLKRIQTAVFQQNIIQKWLKICKLFVSTAGQMGHNKKSEDGTVQTLDTPVLTPVLKIDSFPTLLNLVLPQFNPNNEEKIRIPKQTIWRHTRSGILTAIVLTVPTIFFIKWWAIAVFFGLLLLSAFSGLLHHKIAYFAQTNDIVTTAFGWFTFRKFFLPTSKVQAITVRQSPAQRRLGLASLDLASAAPTFQKTTIEDGAVADIKTFAETIHARSKTTRDSLLDGF